MSRFTLPSEEVLRAREKLVLDHFHDEVTQDWDPATVTWTWTGPHSVFTAGPVTVCACGDEVSWPPAAITVSPPVMAPIVEVL